MRVSAADEELRAALFRLVDVVPACADDRDVARHLVALLEEVRRPSPGVALARRAIRRPPSRAAAGWIATRAVRQVAHRFIAGSDPEAAAPRLRALWEAGVGCSVDLLGETTVNFAEADAYARRCERALVTLSEAARRWPSRPGLERDSLGPVPRVNLSVKVTALTPLIRPDAPELGHDDAARRLRPLLRRARELEAHLHVDMESLDSLELIAGVVFDLLAEPEFRDGPAAGMVLQAYLRDSPALLGRIVEWTRATDRAQPLTVRLVKGAYWDHESVEAVHNGWPSPVFESKAETDRNFELLSRELIDASSLLRPAIASHNLRSVAHALAHAELAGRGGEIEVQVLRGLGDDLQHALAADGVRVRAYCPVGDLVAGMAYLVRRLLENTSNESFLANRAEGAELDALLKAP